MTESLTHWYSPKITQQELSNEYQHDRFLMVLKNLCVMDENSLSIGRISAGMKPRSPNVAGTSQVLPGMHRNVVGIDHGR